MFSALLPGSFMRMSWVAVTVGLLAAGCTEVSFSSKVTEDVPIYIVDTDVRHTDVPDPGTNDLPYLSFAPAQLDFGYVDQGGTATKTLSVTNDGDVLLTLSDLAVVGGGPFTWEVDDEPFELGPGQSAPIRVIYTPSNADAADDLFFRSNDPYAPTATVPLLGTGRNPLVVGSPSPLTFGDVPVGDVDVATLVLTNVGNVPVTVSDLTSSEPVFTPVPLAADLVIDPQTSATVDVVFTPGAPVAYAGELLIVSDARLTPAPVPVLGGGNGPPDAICSVTPTVVSTLGGTATFVGSASSDPRGRALTYDWSFLQVPSGSAVSFAGLGLGPDRGPISPDKAGDYIARLVVTNDLGMASAPCDVTLSVAEVPRLVANPTALDFGSVALGSSATRVFTLTNTGNAPADVSRIATSILPLSLVTLPPFTVDPGASVPVTVRFTPPGLAARNGTFTVESNAPGPEPVVTAVGQGEASDPIAVCTGDPSTVVAIHETFSFVGSGSSDPNGSALTYTWDWISQPGGSNLSLAGSGPNRGPLRPLTVGTYTARLTVTNAQGHTDTCEATVVAEPNAALWVEMFWTYGGDDMDLHLVRANGAFGSNQDCHYDNCADGDHLPWGVAGTADDPYLDLDDIVGVGPENVNIATPELTYFYVAVHDFPGSVDYLGNPVTVKVYLDGNLRFNQTRTITGEDSVTVFALIDLRNASAPTVTSVP